MEQAADRLLELIDEWLKEAGECSSNLKGLARELRSLRENCNAVETVGSTVAVAGSVLAIGGAFFTGGLSLALLGAVGGVGAGVSVVTKITEQFMTSSKLNRVKEIDKNCNKISAKIESLFNQLRDECPSSEDTQKDQYAVTEILKAISRRSGIGDWTYVTDFHDVVHGLIDNDLVKAISKGVVVSLMGEFLSAFCLLSAAASKGGAQVGKAVAIRGASKFLGGVVGLAFSLPEAIDNWTEAIKNKHETEASKSLRDTAEKIDDTRRNLKDKLSQIQTMLKDAAKRHRDKPKHQSISRWSSFQFSQESSFEYLDTCQPNMFSLNCGGSSSSSENWSSSSSCSSSSSSSSSGYEEVELKMAVLNSRSVNKLIKKGDRALIELIQNNNLDVLLITETWLLEGQTTDDIKKILPPNYDVFSEPRGHGRGGGVAIVYSTEYECYSVTFDNELTIRCNLMNDGEFKCYSDPFDNGLTVRFEYIAALLCCPCAVNGILMLNIYRPPKQYPEFFEELEKLLSKAFDQYSLVVIGGDFNIWVDCPRDRFSAKFQKLLERNGLVQHVSDPTHKGGHILDLVQTRPNVRISNVSVRPNSFSDHHTVFFSAHYRSQNAIRSERSVKRRKEKKKRKRQRRRDRHHK